MPVKHIVMFGFKEGTGEDDLKRIEDALLALPGQIPQIQQHEVGRDLLLESGQKHPAGKNRRISWTCTFNSADDYEIYSVHPAHIAFVTLLKTVMEQGTRAAIQYEF